MSKTTVIGLVTIGQAALAVAYDWLHGVTPNWAAFGVAITTGIGLIHSADAPKKNGNGNAQPH